MRLATVGHVSTLQTDANRRKNVPMSNPRFTTSTRRVPTWQPLQSRKFSAMHHEQSHQS
jgi:hypothetical protein